MPWTDPPRDLVLSSVETHVYAFDLDVPAVRVAELTSLLSKDERNRAARFKFDKHRRRYIACRGTLRTILGRYLGLEPLRLEFAYGPQGKPALTNGHEVSDLQFNLSRSHERGIVAVHRQEELGVDIEHLRPIPDALQIARRFFSTEEYRALDALPPAEHGSAFFGYWTRKEAVVKSIGMGLSLPTESFTLCAEPGAEAEVVEIPQLHTSRWVLPLPQPGTEYLAALATAEQPQALSCWTWT